MIKRLANGDEMQMFKLIENAIILGFRAQTVYTYLVADIFIMGNEVFRLLRSDEENYCWVKLHAMMCIILEKVELFELYRGIFDNII